MKKLVLVTAVVAGVVGVCAYRHYAPHADGSLCSTTCVHETVPAYLYKIVSVQDWALSKDQDAVKLSSMDNRFIHLATDEQLDKIVKKFWAQEPEVVILKLDVTHLPGDLKFEHNVGGENKYYHLYNGSLPHNAVIAVEIRKV